MDSDADPATGRVDVTTPPSGESRESSSTTRADDPDIDAGLVKYNLRLTKAVIPADPADPSTV